MRAVFAIALLPLLALVAAEAEPARVPGSGARPAHAGERRAHALPAHINRRTGKKCRPRPKTTTATTTTAAPNPTDQGKDKDNWWQADSSTSSSTSTSSSDANASPTDKDLNASPTDKDLHASPTDKDPNASPTDKDTQATSTDSSSSDSSTPAPSPTGSGGDQGMPQVDGGYDSIGTFYDTYESGQPGACSWENSNEEDVVAVSTEFYANGAVCGKWVTVTNTENGKTKAAKIVDQCMGCHATGKLDLSKALFDYLSDGNRDKGELKITWKLND